METLKTLKAIQSTYVQEIFLPDLPTTIAPLAADTTMLALVYQSPGVTALVSRPKPHLQHSTDAIIRLTKTTICGTDMHIIKGDVPTCKPGTILGHEGVGVVDEVGSGVQGFNIGDRVLISCICACSTCEYCRRGMFSHCTSGGWILGNTIDGTQAEYVRIPHADSSLYLIPPNANEAALVMLSDIFPTGLECGVQNSKVNPGSSVAIVGGGPVGLAAMITAQFYSPSTIIMICTNESRLAVAKALGADFVVNPKREDVEEVVRSVTGGRGCDCVMEAVGVPASFEMCEKIVAPGGVIANVGVHGTKVDLHLEDLWAKNISITTRLVDTVTTPMLMKLVMAGKIDPAVLITHRFAFKDMDEAYRTFGAASKHDALKVLIEF